MRLASASALSLAALLAFPATGLTQDVPPAVAAVLKSWETQFKSAPTYKSIETDGDGTVTITELQATVGPADAPGPKPVLTIGSVELEEISDEGDGLYEIGAVTYSDMKVSIDDPAAAFTLEIPEMSAEDWYVTTLSATPTAAEKLRAGMSLAKKTTSGKITVNAGGQTITADGFEGSWDGDPLTGAGKMAGKVSNVVLPESTMAMMDPTSTLKGLGYTTLSFDIGGEGSFANDGEKIGFDGGVYYALKDMGTLRTSLAASDIPMTLVEAMQNLKPGEPPNALLPQAMGINIGSFVLRFEDASITKKLLPLIAQMQGLDEATFIANAGAMAQIGLAELKNPELTKQAVAAINSFLADPKSLTVALKPASPVPVAQLMTIDPTNPGAAATMLGLSITAND